MPYIALFLEKKFKKSRSAGGSAPRPPRYYFTLIVSAVTKLLKRSILS